MGRSGKCDIWPTSGFIDSDTPQHCKSKTYTLHCPKSFTTVAKITYIYIYCISISNFLNQMCTSPWESLDTIASKQSLFLLFWLYFIFSQSIMEVQMTYCRMSTCDFHFLNSNILAVSENLHRGPMTVHYWPRGKLSWSAFMGPTKIEK